MPVILGGPDAYRVHRKGQFIVALQHVGVGGDDPEPSLVVWPTRAAPGAGAFVLGLSSISLYLDSRTGMPTPYAVENYGRALEAMKLSITDRFAIRQLCDIVYEFAPDLITMPPYLKPTPAPKGVDAVTLLVDGEKHSTVNVAH